MTAIVLPAGGVTDCSNLSHQWGQWLEDWFAAHASAMPVQVKSVGWLVSLVVGHASCTVPPLGAYENSNIPHNLRLRCGMISVGDPQVRPRAPGSV